jgi:calmodulin
LLKKGKEILKEESEEQQAKINDDSLGLSGALLPLFMRDHLEVKTVKSDTDALKVFRRFQDDNYVHVDDLPLCLAAVGFALHEDWIPGLLRDITSYSQLTLDNYLQFIEAFKSRQKESQRADFDRIDIDGSGTLDMDELAELLHSWGTWPMTHVLQELLDEADLDGNGKLDFEEFQNVVYLLRSRQGFCKSEYEEMISIFRMFDRNSQGLMAISDLRVALDWLGFVLTKEQVDIIISELDDDDRGQFDELEWLTCMRKVREQKVAELKRVIEDHDVQGHGSIQKMMLTPVLCSLGYFPDDQAVRETAAVAGISEDSIALDIGELWRFMKVYRDREGLTSKEVQEIEDGFLQCGVVLEGEVNMMQIGKIVRGIGYMLPFDTQQKLIAKVDITGNGKLTQREFRKMIRLVNQQDIDIIRLAFHESANLIETKAENVMGFTNAELLERLARDCTQFRPGIPEDSEFITVSQATRALSRLGCIDAEGIVAPLHACDMIGPDCVDIFGFCNASRRALQASRVAFRKNGGFSQEDIHKMEDKFHEFDVDGNGELNGSEIIKVFEVHFPTLANDATRRPLILQLLKEADEDSSGTLDFGDFLRLMRQVTDIQDQLMIRKELQAIADTKFSPSEVLEFRELVLAVRGEEAEIGFDEVVRLLGAIVPMGAKNILQLRTMFDDAAKRQSGVEGSEEKLDFPEFLWLMRDVLDANFANMSERVAVVQEELVQERRKTRLSVMTEDEQQLDEKRRTWKQKTLDMRSKTGDLLTIPDC